MFPDFFGSALGFHYLRTHELEKTLPAGSAAACGRPGTQNLDQNPPRIG